MTLGIRSALATVALASGLSGCGSDGPGSVTPIPAVAGRYVGRWVLQVHRLEDDFHTSFICGGSLTIAEGSAGPGAASFSGLAAGDPPCAPGPFALFGTVAADDYASFTAESPPPPEGPCPGSSVRFVGRLSEGGLEAVGRAVVVCPTYGVHEITYELSFSRRRH